MLLLVPLPMLASLALAISPTLPASLLLESGDASDGVPIVGVPAFEGVLALLYFMLRGQNWSYFRPSYCSSIA
jgi:hypothetical protein